MSSKNDDMKVACFCGSADEAVSVELKKCAEEVGRCLAKGGFRLLTGGSETGLLKSVCQGYLTEADASRVQLVIPEDYRKYIDYQLEAIDKEKIIWVNTTKEQLSFFEKAAGVYVLMPGGYGTLLELFYFLTCKRLAQLGTRIIVFNSNGFYDHLMMQLDVLVAEKTLTQKNRCLFKTVSSIEQLEAALKETH